MVRKITHPAPVQTPGGKTIHEYVGRIRTGSEAVSVARMVAPPGWSEPFQQPSFDEITLVVRGVIRVEHRNGSVDVGSGEVVLVPAGTRTRYSNPGREDAAYWAVCVPAFSTQMAGREN